MNKKYKMGRVYNFSKDQKEILNSAITDVINRLKEKRSKKKKTIANI